MAAQILPGQSELMSSRCELVRKSILGRRCSEFAMRASTYACCWAALPPLLFTGGCARRSTIPSGSTKSPEPPKTPPADVRTEIHRLTSAPEAAAKQYLDSLRFDDPQVSYQLANPLYRRITKFSRHEESVAYFRGGLGKIRQQQTWDQNVGISPSGVNARFMFRLYGEVQPCDAFVTLIHQSGKWSVVGFFLKLPTTKGLPKNTTERA